MRDEDKAPGDADVDKPPRPCNSGLTVASGSKVSSFEDLIVWQRAMALVRDVYAISRSFPSDEKFGLTSQIRRAVVSVPSNIAEGHERHTTREFVRFVSDAEGSLAEVRTQLLIANDLGYCSVDIDRSLRDADEIRRMLNALRRSLNARNT